MIRKFAGLVLSVGSLGLVTLWGCSDDPGTNSGNSTGATGGTGQAGMGGTAGGGGAGSGGAGTGGRGGTAGTAGTAGASGSAGSGGIAGTAGNAGSAGTGGLAGSAGTAGTAGTAGAGGMAGTGGGGGGGVGGDPGDAARGDIVVDRLLVNQAVQIEVYKDGSVVAPASRNAPLTSGRPALVQALWTVPGGWTARPILGRLHAKYAGGREKSFDTTVTVSGASGEGDLEKSIHWLVPKEDVEAGMTFQVRLREGEPGHDTIPPSAQPPEAPVGMFADLGVPEDPIEVHITIVPVKFNSGSCSTDTRAEFTEQRLKEWTDFHYSQGPSQAVKLTVNPKSVEWDGSSWQGILASLQQLRIDDNAQPNEYYYAPADSCTSDPEGFGGYSYIADDSKQGASDRVSAGRYREDDEFTRVTFVHETGHAQGRQHAPCGGPAGPDPAFPYSDGSIGVWGFDLINSTFRDPAEVHDYMTYCYFPSWASDWTFGKHHAKAITLTSWGPSPNPKAGLREVLYGTLPANGGPSKWWTTLGGVNASYASPGEFVEFTMKDGSSTRAPAVIQNTEGGDRYLKAEVPKDFANIASMARISNAASTSIPLNLRRIIK